MRIAVQGEVDCREVERDGRPGVEFSWEGSRQSCPGGAPADAADRVTC